MCALSIAACCRRGRGGCAEGLGTEAGPKENGGEVMRGRAQLQVPRKGGGVEDDGLRSEAGMCLSA